MGLTAGHARRKTMIVRIVIAPNAKVATLPINCSVLGFVVCVTLGLYVPTIGMRDLASVARYSNPTPASAARHNVSGIDHRNGVCNWLKPGMPKNKIAYSGVPKMNNSDTMLRVMKNNVGALVLRLTFDV